MRKLILAALGVLFSLSIGGCGTTIQPGHVGILVNQYGQNRGVQDYTTTTGRVWYNPISTSVIEYPTYVQTVKWTANPHEGGLNDRPGSGTENESITFTTKESMAVNADISLSFQLQPELIPAFYVKFRSDDLSNFTYGFLHNVTRDAMMEIGGHYTVEQIMGNNEPFLHEVRDRIQAQMTPIGVQIQQFGLIGAPRPPQQVVDSINAAEQAKYLALQKQNELEQTKADAAKRIAEAEGLAKANFALSQSITPNLLEKQRLDIQDRWISRWNGQTPTVTSGNSSGLLMTLPTSQKPN
jgi:regulator of protease activity HflC (stomatin/prohibitin superfamily)